MQTKLLFIVFMMLVCGAGLSRTNAQSAKPVPAVLDVPFAPIPVKAMDRMNLAYELHITNFSRTNLVLTGVEVLADDAQKTSLVSYRDAELLKRLLVISPAADSQEKNVIGGGQRAIAFLMISTDAAVPNALRHRLFFKSTDAANDKEQTVEGMRVAVQSGKALVIGSPLRGRWIAVNGFSNPTTLRHRLDKVRR